MFPKYYLVTVLAAITAAGSANAAPSKCDAAGAKEQDTALKAAYERALSSMDAPARPAFETSQREWLKNYKETTATFLADPTCTPGKLLGAETLTQRLAWVEGRAETGAREPIVQPFSVWRDAKPGGWRLILDLTRIEKPSLPGDYLFNSTIARIKKDAENRTRPSNADAGDVGIDHPYEYSAKVRITYASPRLLSARIDADEEAGGPHGSYPTWGVTIDRVKGIALNIDDLFDAGAYLPLVKDCLRQIAKETGRKLDGEWKENVDKGVRDLGHWHFKADGATVVFGDYEIGSFADGHPSCHFPLATLKKLAWPDALLPE